MKHPNILYVFADQWRAQSLGYAGCSQVRTPHLDAFAQRSLNLPQAVANTPVCAPYRATLISGLMPDKHGVFLNDAALDPTIPSFGKVFRDAGYDTAWVGKWHVDGQGWYTPIPPERRHGFKHWRALELTHTYNHSQYYGHEDNELRTWEGYDAIAQTDDLIKWIQSGRDSSKPFCAALSWGPPHSPYDTAPESYQALYHPDSIELPPNVPADP